MVDINIMVKCQKIGCPRSILYCYECDNMKEINHTTLKCGWNET